MKLRLQYLYHLIMSVVLDVVARIASYLLRKAGRASNLHDARKDVARINIQRGL